MNHPHLLAMARREIAAGTKIVIFENGALREVSEEELAQRIAAAQCDGGTERPSRLIAWTPPALNPEQLRHLAEQFPPPQKLNRAQRRAKR